MHYERALQTAIEAALEAGEILRNDFHRPGGPRGHGEHAEADEEAEWIIRRKLLAAFPHYRYRGEETGSVATEDPHVWLVDPNDGTIAYLRGARGSAVSIGLVRNGIPILGVVYAFAAPDDRGDLISWAEGCHLTRNGKPVEPMRNSAKRNQIVVLFSTHREAVMEAVLHCIHPYRYRALPSIAYRLALAAAGEGHAAVSWHSPGDWDYAAGHALIRAAGGVFWDEQGCEITYASDGASKVKLCFGGDEEIVADLYQREWNAIQTPSTGALLDSPFLLARLKPGSAVADPSLLVQAQGCLLGQVTGDALGQQVEFMDQGAIRKKYPEGLNRMEDGGAWNTIAGQLTDDSELALLLSRSIIKEGAYVPEKVAQAYHYWFHKSEPFDIGQTTAQAMRAVSAEDVQSGRAAAALSKNASQTSQSNGSLMRISPLGIFGYRKSPEQLWQLACEESSLTHPHPVCQQACALFVAAIAQAIHRDGGKPAEIYEHVLRLAGEKHVESSLMDALRNAASHRPEFGHNQGWVLTAFQNAFYELIHSISLEESIRDTVMQGGDTDTNAAIAGALLGAVYGRNSIPFAWTQMVLSCRPHSITGTAHPRPFCLWPVDLFNLAELLLLCG